MQGAKYTVHTTQPRASLWFSNTGFAPNRLHLGFNCLSAAAPVAPVAPCAVLLQLLAPNSHRRSNATACTKKNTAITPKQTPSNCGRATHQRLGNVCRRNFPHFVWFEPELRGFGRLESVARRCQPEWACSQNQYWRFTIIKYTILRYTIIRYTINQQSQWNSEPGPPKPPNGTDLYTRGSDDV
jgi:hypothetical protein